MWRENRRKERGSHPTSALSLLLRPLSELSSFLGFKPPAVPYLLLIARDTFVFRIEPPCDGTSDGVATSTSCLATIVAAGENVNDKT